MFKLNKKYIYLIVMLVTVIMQAQQDPNYTQYMYNTMAINPAYAGSSESFNVVGIYRSQWVGFDGAPKTINLSIESPFNEKIGLGLNLSKDVIGPTENFKADGNFSYSVQFDRDIKIAFGLKAGAQLLNVDFTKGDYQNAGDPLFTNNIDNKLLAALGAGVYLYKYNWYIGLSVPDFLNQEYYDNVDQALATNELQSYLSAGYVFDISPTTRFKPAVLFNHVSGAPIRTNVAANMLFSDTITLGVSYQINDAVSALAGFQITNSFFLGYSFDYNTTELSKYNSGTHEIILKYSFAPKRGMSFSPRFF